VLQVRTADYTATNGTSVVLAIGATASDVVNVVAYGAFNVANTYTQAQADARYPLNTSSFFAGKNKIINGDFGVWQRGTSLTQPSGVAFGYSGADRWIDARNGGGTVTISQQTFTPGAAPVAGYEGKFFYRYNQSVAGSGQTYSVIAQRIEDVQTLAGQTVTVSFWAKADASRSINLGMGQYFGTGGSSAVATTIGAFNLTTSWTRYTATINLPSLTGKTIGASSYLTLEMNLPVNTTFTFDMWGVQVEAGSVATAFQTASGSLQGELALCQRYYYRNAFYGIGNGTFILFGVGQAISITTSNIVINFPVTMRSEPQVVDFAGLAFTDYTNNILPAVTSMSIYISRRSPNLCFLQVVASAASLTLSANYYLTGNGSGTSYVGLSAEL
jgi:hypothetical protein